jgi:hypothetical protein
MSIKLSLPGKVKVHERLIKELGQTLTNIGAFVKGAMEQFGQSVYTVSIIQAALIEHLNCDAEVKAIVERMERERKERDEEAAAHAQGDDANRVEGLTVPLTVV